MAAKPTAAPEPSVALDPASRQLVLDFPSLGEALRLFQPPGNPGGRGAAVQALEHLFASAGLGLQVRVQEHEVARIGAGSVTGLALRLLGIDQTSRHEPK